MTFAKSKASKPSLQGSARTRGPTGPLGGGRSAISMQLSGALALRVRPLGARERQSVRNFSRGLKRKKEKRLFLRRPRCSPKGWHPVSRSCCEDGAGMRREEVWALEAAVAPRSRTGAAAGGRGSPGSGHGEPAQPGGSRRPAGIRSAARPPARRPQSTGTSEQGSLRAGASWCSSRITALEQMSGCLLSKSNALFLANPEIQFG